MRVDMSPEAVTGRLRRCSQLRRLCLSLAKARPVPPTATPDPDACSDNAGASERSDERQGS